MWEVRIEFLGKLQGGISLGRPCHRCLSPRRGHEPHGIFQASIDKIQLAMIRNRAIIKLPTSIELNGLPLYTSANSAASVGLKNFKTTNERFGAKSLGGQIR